MNVQGKKLGTLLRAGALALALVFNAPLSALAQDPIAPEPINPFAAGVVIDYREHMRQWVQTISEGARTVNPNFLVIAKDGLALVDKPDPADDTLSFPARAYMRALDGVLETNLLDETITTPEGKPSPDLEAVLKLRKTHEATAAEFGLTIFNLEFSNERDAVSKLYADSAKKGYVPFVAEGPALANIPKFPGNAYGANPLSVSAAAEVRNYLYVTNSKPFGTAPEYVRALRSTNYDIVAIDVFHGRKPLTKQDVASLKYKKLGAKRLVLAEIDISSAATFRYYWQAGWGKGNPGFMWTPVRVDPDRYRTIYWDPAWQTIIAGDTSSYLYGVIDLGFDGVVLKGVDAWRFFEAGGEE